MLLGKWWKAETFSGHQGVESALFLENELPKFIISADLWFYLKELFKRSPLFY